MADRNLGLDIQQILDDIALVGWESDDEVSRSERRRFYFESEGSGGEGAGADALLVPIDGAYNFPIFWQQEEGPALQPQERAHEEAGELDAAIEAWHGTIDEDEAEADLRQRQRGRKRYREESPEQQQLQEQQGQP